MASAMPIDHLFASMVPGTVPGSRVVADLAAALELVQRVGGAVASETRTVPGIGSWAFVADHDGNELVLWQAAVT